MDKRCTKSDFRSAETTSIGEVSEGPLEGDSSDKGLSKTTHPFATRNGRTFPGPPLESEGRNQNRSGKERKELHMPGS